MTSDFDVIKRIREVANSSKSKLIKELIVDGDEITELTKLLSSDNRIVSGYADVPISSIVSLNRKNDTWVPGQSWIDVLNDNLIGKGWSEKALDYFVSDMFDTEFPAPGSSGRLSLISYNGITKCSNGNHRLSAVICWLASTIGDHSKIRKVYTDLVPLDKNKIELAKKLKNEFSESWKVCSELNPWGKNTFNVNSLINIGHLYFSIGSGVELVFNNRASRISSFIDWLIFDSKKKDMLRCIESQRWVSVSESVLRRLFDSVWFVEAYEAHNKNCDHVTINPLYTTM